MNVDVSQAWGLSWTAKDLKWLLTNPRNYLLWLLWHRSLESWTVSQKHLFEISRTILCLGTLLKPCILTNSRQTYVLFTWNNFIIIAILSILLHKISKHHFIFHNKFHSLKIPFNENIQLWPIPIWKSIHDPPYPKPRSYIPRYYHKFPAYCTTSCAPRHRFLTQQIPKVILLQQRSSIKIQLSS